ncbi:MAG: sugar ABC transporter substrate-binding protein [Candidatus Gastranaerophilaceae bacterium]
MRGERKLLIFIALITLLLTGCIKKDSRTVIQFATWGSQSEVAILKPILAEFERENPDVKVDLIHIPQNYFQKIHLLFASNLAPDVIFINNLYLPVYANAGVLQELKSRTVEKPISLTVSKKNHSTFRPFNHSIFYNKALDALSYDGKLYAIPRDVSNLVIYYNKDLFDKYKVPYPKANWTFKDFLAVAQRLTKDTNNDGKRDIWGVSFEEDPPLFYLPYLMSEGGGVLSDDLKTLIIDTPQSQKGLRFYADLRNKYHVAPTKAESASATMAQLFLQGKLAMQVSGRWLVPKYREDAKFNWDVINFPRGDKGSVVPLDASGWAISKSSKHKEEAAKLVEFLASKKSIEKFTRSGLIVPARVDVAEGEFLDRDSAIKNCSSYLTPHPYLTSQPKDTQSLDFGRVPQGGRKNPYNVRFCRPKSERVFIDVIKTSKPTPVSVDYSEIQDELQEKTNYLFNLNTNACHVLN